MCQISWTNHNIEFWRFKGKKNTVFETIVWLLSLTLDKWHIIHVWIAVAKLWRARVCDCDLHKSLIHVHSILTTINAIRFVSIARIIMCREQIENCTPPSSNRDFRCLCNLATSQNSFWSWQADAPSSADTRNAFVNVSRLWIESGSSKQFKSDSLCPQNQTDF